MAALLPPDPDAPGRDRLRRALAEQAAHRTDLRSRRAERLARIRTATPGGGALTLLAPREPAPAEAAHGMRDPAAQPAAAPSGPTALTAAGLRDAEALESLLAALAGTFEPAPRPETSSAAPAEVVPLPRPERRAEGDAAGLATLPGAGPGLVAALVRAGVPDLAALAALGRDALAARLGPLARLIDLDLWLAHARGQA